MTIARRYIEENLMTATPQFGFALEYVNDVEATKRFYTEVMGLEIQRYHPSYVQFENFAIANDESMTGTREPELYWLVEDADAALRELSGKGEVSMPMREEAFGKVFAVKDPDGRPRFLLELSKNRPSVPA
jgi:predicted enzyme related to lactoylglutathione lyase